MRKPFPYRVTCPLWTPSGKSVVENSSLRIRPAVDSDSWICAELTNTAADGMFADLFGNRWQSIVSQLSKQPGHSMSLEHVRVLDQDGEVVGMAAAMTGLEAKKGFDSQLWNVAGWRTIRALVMSLALRPMFRFLDFHEPDEFYLQALATRASRRGQGLGTRLLNDVNERGMAAGSHRLALHVDKSNVNAQRLYDRYGFSYESISTPALFAGGERIERWVKSLPDGRETTDG